MFERIKLIRRILKVLNRIEGCAARQIRILPESLSSDPDILAVIRGRAIFLNVIPPKDTVSERSLDHLDFWIKSEARVATVRDPRSAARLIASVAEAQDSLAAYAPREDLMQWRQTGG